MSRQVFRVPSDFTWPVGEIWMGFILPAIPCPLCKGSQKSPTGTGLHGDDRHTYTSEWCPLCEGEGDVAPRLDPPTGPWWQMWETTTEGSPMSPPCESPEALARWLADNEASSFGRDTATYEQWLGMIRGPGWAPTFVASGGEQVSGVEFVAKGG